MSSSPSLVVAKWTGELDTATMSRKLEGLPRARTAEE
jgi:hypothetical protein